MQSWQDLAAQIVLVDSFSTDGTDDYLRQRLQHPGFSFFQHPPGLYQSWNFGIRQLETKFAYIATAGDTITRQGMMHLLNYAESLDAAVLISKPVFMADSIKPGRDIRWPIDDLIQMLGLTQPRTVSWLEVLLFAAVHLDGTLLGSSASNLYRTDVLQKFPFPDDFGKAGDAAWGALHFADVKWAVTPEKFSTFLCHPDWTASTERQNFKTSTRLDKVLRDAVETAAANGTVPRVALEEHAIAELLDAASLWMDGKQAFDRQRRREWPWFLNPAAWQARSSRQRQHRRLLQWRARVLARLGTGPIHGAGSGALGERALPRRGS
jgi:hypothetical protein